MDIDEFQQQNPPRAKRSKLEPFIDQIRALKTNGYANWQVCEWLATNDVKISVAGFRKFWIKSEQNRLAAPPADAPRPARPGSTGAPQTQKRRITNPGELNQAANREINLEDLHPTPPIKKP